MNEIKKYLWEIVDKDKEKLLEICSDLIKTPSENPPGDVELVTRFICKCFEESYIPCKIVRPTADKPNIIVTLGNDNGKTLLLNGHSDVVPAGNLKEWNFDPYCGSIENGRMLGRGTSDMKCGLGALIFAMKVLKDYDLNIEGKIVLHVVPDEETGGEFGTKWLYENGYFEKGDACLIAEPTSYNNCEVGQKGSLLVNLKSYGIPAHGSIGNYVGDNAILNLSKLLVSLDEIRSLKGRYQENQTEVLQNSKKIAKEALKVEGVENAIDHVTVNIGTINGGTKHNMVAEYCEATLDIRIPIGIDESEVLTRIDRLLQELKLDKIKYDYVYNSPANYTDTDSDIVKFAVSNAKHIWNKDVVPAYQWASSDARYYRLKNIPTIQYGPANTEGIHSYNETVDVEDIVNSTKVYLGIMSDLLNLSK